jgi:hypothetical protein
MEPWAFCKGRTRWQSEADKTDKRGKTGKGAQQDTTGHGETGQGMTHTTCQDRQRQTKTGKVARQASRQDSKAKPHRSQTSQVTPDKMTRQQDRYTLAVPLEACSSLSSPEDGLSRCWRRVGGAAHPSMGRLPFLFLPLVFMPAWGCSTQMIERRKRRTKHITKHPVYRQGTHMITLFGDKRGSRQTRHRWT